MKELLRLPYDSSGFGDFGASYIGADARVHFQYKGSAGECVGELYFEFCVNMTVNGILNAQRDIPYDTVLREEYRNERYDGFFRYLLMLSGSDFQFEVIAKDCKFREVGASYLVGE